MRATGRRDDRRELAVRRVAVQPPAAVERHPDAALGVDGQAVGDGALDLDGGEPPPVLEGARLRVEVEHVDAPGRAVDEVEAVARRAPAEPVRDRGAGQHRRDREVGVDPVQPAERRRLVERHRPDPQPAGGVARAVVGARVRARRVDGYEQRRPLAVEDVQAVRQPDDGPAAPARQRQAHDAGDELRRVQSRLGVVPVHAMPRDVDPEQRPGRGIPARALAELRARVGGDVELSQRTLRHPSSILVRPGRGPSASLRSAGCPEPLALPRGASPGCTG